ncbi:lysophospholipid acyltransferase family protein [Pararhodobacter oceanensis]|uniref:lysophospholipid acyltransferase family protein n=1 Tax=Pararhodobacter oceanensis TaxID=2172121 RepID=UPI003A959076
MSTPAPDADTGADTPTETRRDRLGMAYLSLLSYLPFPARVRLSGWLGEHLVGRLSSVRRKVRAAVAHFMPDLPEAEAQRIAAQVPGNLARLATEILSPEDLARLAATVPPEGPGFAAIEEAKAQGRAAILVSAHFGNYDVPRLSLNARGYHIGGFYKAMSSPALNDLYVRSVSASGAPMFPDTSEGLKGLLRFMRKGGMFGILIDLDRPNGVLIDFLGRPTRTVLSIAEMALKYDALVVPVFGIRTPEAPGFRIHIDTPVAHSTPEQMTQDLNARIGAQVRAHPAQWVWWHKRRKPDHP